MARHTSDNYTQIDADFTERLARMAAAPQHGQQFVEQVAASAPATVSATAAAQDAGPVARHRRPLLRAVRRQVHPGWLAHHRRVRPGEKAFKIWAPRTRRPCDD
jgi:hypothetical protein